MRNILIKSVMATFFLTGAAARADADACRNARCGSRARKLPQRKPSNQRCQWIGLPAPANNFAAVSKYLRLAGGRAAEFKRQPEVFKRKYKRRA